jgi:hypothetical protein
MLVELCVGNKTMYDGLVNGIDGILKASTTYCDKTNIWIMFQNSKIGTLTRENIIIITTTTLNKNGTPIEPIIKDIRVDKSQSFIIISIQFPIQLVAPKTIHHSQGLSLDELAFDPSNVKKHGLMHTTLYHIQTKEKLFC